MAKVGERLPEFETQVNRLLGLELTTRTKTTAEVSMPVIEAYDQGTGVVQGGIISSLADATAVAALATSRPFGRAMASIEFKINFIRPARSGAGPLLGKAAVVRSGRTIAVCEVEILQAEVLVAKGLFTYLYLDAR